MLVLTANDISLNGKARNKAEAIELIVQSMVTTGLVEPDYLAGMLARENQTSTFLGNGIAIPHGTPETRNLVNATGIKVCRFPNGIDWGNGQVAYTVIGIAAQSDEHLDILRQLTHVIIDEELSSRLHSTAEIDEVLSILKGESYQPTLTIDSALVRDQLNVQSMVEAQSIAASVLYSSGYCDANTRNGFLDQAPLSFGGGIWISTLLSENTHPALSVISIAQPFQHEGQDVKLFLMLTTQGTSHQKLFDRLLQLKRDDALVQLANAKTAQAITKLLKMEAIEGESIEIRLPIEHGLHARPASQLAKLIKSINGQVWVENLDGDSGAVKGESVARLISLGAGFSHLLRFTVAECDNTQQALNLISNAVSEGLGDPILPISEVINDEGSKGLLTQAALVKLEAGATVSGQCGATGLAFGQTQLLSKIQFDYPEQGQGRDGELGRFNSALVALIQRLKEQLAKQVNSTKAQIVAMHIELLEDPILAENTVELIEIGKSAESAWVASYEELAAQLEQNKDELLAERATDYRDLGYRLLLELTGSGEESYQQQPHILICDEINPSQVVEFDRQIVKAIVTARGGTTSHAAILARAAGIPLLVGCGASVLSIANNTSVVVDCDKRFMRLVIDESELLATQNEIAVKEIESKKAIEDRFLPATTQDGKTIEVVANISSSRQIEGALENGAEGVGLFRSEFLYMEHTSEPTHEQQVAEYKAVLSALGNEGKPFIVRTLDVGGDKPLPYLAMEKEENPFLGVRGARLSLLYPDMFTRQIKALFEAASEGLLRIMFPMISDIHEWRKLKQLYLNVARDYPAVTLELGMMIEIPSAALMADVFAPELDFFSIGTNDLTQYTVAIDRGHSLLSKQVDPLNPAILKLIDMTVKAADNSGIWVGVCGELAADPFAAEILVGLGVKELSMSSNAIPLVKSKIRMLDLPSAKKLAEMALKAESAEAVYALKAVGSADV